MYDLIIIGGSAASTAASIYAVRRKLNFKVISKDFGGEVATSGEIGNWPGITETNGIELADKFKEHLDFYGVKPELGVEVEKIAKKEDGSFCVTTKKGKEIGSAAEKMDIQNGDESSTCDYEAKVVILSTGVHPRELNVSGEKEFRNKGVSYCTTCDGPLFQDKITATVGGGNSALESAIMMSGIAKKHYVINKNPQFKGEAILIDKVTKMENVEVIYNADTTEITGDVLVKALKYKDKDGEEKQLDVEGIFVHIGNIPNSNMVPEGVEKNKFGEIVVNLRGETNVSGFYAAGDVTNIPYKQIVIAAGQGTTAVLSAIDYLNRLE